jgi:hypothetical protein
MESDPLWKTLSRAFGFGKHLIPHIPKQKKLQKNWHIHPAQPAILLTVKK